MAASVGAPYLGEFPEALGATKDGISASIWQMQQFQDILVMPGSKTFALLQCEFGASTPKPTRFVTDLNCCEGNIYMGVPQFDSTWHYKGPLPPRCTHDGNHSQLIGTDDQGQWKTGQQHITRALYASSLHVPLRRLGYNHPPLRGGKLLRMS